MVRRKRSFAQGLRRKHDFMNHTTTMREEKYRSYFAGKGGELQDVIEISRWILIFALGRKETGKSHMLAAQKKLSSYFTTRLSK